MRVAVISDIHANRPALRAVLAAVDACRPTHVVVAGDIVNRGPQPRHCLETILQRKRDCAWQVLKGNHEDFVLLEASAPAGRAEWERLLYAHTHWTMDRLGEHLPGLRELPDRVVLEGPDGGELRFVHASMRSNRHGLYEDMEEGDVGELIAPAPRVLTVGHTHVPFVRAVGDVLVVNAGAAGLPFDGDPRGSFALLSWEEPRWRAEIIRVSYDRAEAEADFTRTGYLAEGGPMVPLVLDELRHARPRLGWWHRRYEQRVARGEMSLAHSVERLLEDIGEGVRLA